MRFAMRLLTARGREPVLPRPMTTMIPRPRAPLSCHAKLPLRAALVTDSLSIVVPVCNAEAVLAGQLARLLDILPDLTSRFEIVVVDDASTDHTVELARELAVQFPQLKLVRHRERRGAPAAVRTGLQWATGRTVFVQEDAASLSTRDLRRLWVLRNDEDVVVARANVRPRVFDDQLLEQLAAWGQQLKSLGHAATAEGGIHMIRREAALRLLADQASDDSGDGSGGDAAHTAQSPGADLPMMQARADRSHPTAGPRRAATFLRHLKNLALGE
jgi:hypothetical protein